MSIVYTYNTYECDLRTPSSWFTTDNTTNTDKNKIVVEKVIERMGIDPKSIGGCICCGYDVVNDNMRLAFFFFLQIKGTDGVEIITKFYHVECQLTTSNENVVIAGCKVYCSKPGYGKNIELKAGTQGPEDTNGKYWIVSLGYSGKYVTTDSLSEGEYYWKPLYGWYMDQETANNSTYVIIPPKSFFVEGEHKNFIQPNTYTCEQSLEITNIGGSDGPDDDGDNDANSEGD